MLPLLLLLLHLLLLLLLLLTFTSPELLSQGCSFPALRFLPTSWESKLAKRNIQANVRRPEGNNLSTVPGGDQSCLTGGSRNMETAAQAHKTSRRMWRSCVMQTDSGDTGQRSPSISGLLQHNTAVLIIHPIICPCPAPVSSSGQQLKVVMEPPPAVIKAGRHCWVSSLFLQWRENMGTAQQKHGEHGENSAEHGRNPADT